MNCKCKPVQVHKGLWVKKDIKWAQENWDTYGFDYDPLTKSPVFIWPIDTSTKLLKQALEADEVEFESGTRVI